MLTTKADVYARIEVPPDDRQFLAAGSYDSKYLDYDWSLNEHRVE